MRTPTLLALCCCAWPSHPASRIPWHAKAPMQLLLRPSASLTAARSPPTTSTARRQANSPSSSTLQRASTLAARRSKVRAHGVSGKPFAHAAELLRRPCRCPPKHTVGSRQAVPEAFCPCCPCVQASSCPTQCRPSSAGSREGIPLSKCSCVGAASRQVCRAGRKEGGGCPCAQHKQ